MGIIIGGLIGYRIGGIIGMLFGAWLGHQITQFIGGAKSGQSKHTATQQSFFKALFVTMGKLAKADGTISPGEIDRAEVIMRRMKLTPELRQQAILYFNQGKESNYNIDGDLAAFRRNARGSLSLKQFFLEMLIDMASGDGTIDADEQQILEKACQLIGYPPQLLQAMLKMRGAGYYQQHQSQDYGRSQSQSPHRAPISGNPYRILGVEKTDDKQVIRRAYKKLMSQHHPDKLVSKGLPPEMMKMAEEKTKTIQLAWEQVKELRGW